MSANKSDFFLFEKFFQHGIPGVFQGLVQGKNTKGGTADAVQSGTIVADIQKQSIHLLRGEGNSALPQEGFHIVGGQSEDNLKIQGRMLSFGQVKKERPDPFPEGITALFCFQLLRFIAV